MNALRKAHLYLGCFFAPMLLFFAISGIWQMLGLQRYSPALQALSTIHKGNIQTKGGHTLLLASVALDALSVIMALGLAVTVVLGLVLAFRYGRGRLALMCLALGTLLPLVMVFLFAHRG